MAKKKSKPRKIPEVLVFTDTNHRSDTLASLVILSWLADKNLINLRGIITEVGLYETRRRRAMLTKGAMVHLGQPFLRVAVGGDYIAVDEQEENFYPETEWTQLIETSGTSIQRSGTTFLQEYIKAAEAKNVYVLLNAPFPDFAKYIQGTEEALAKKLKKIVVSGDVLSDKDENGNYLPDTASYNFKIGTPAAQILFKYAQERDIRLVVASPKNVQNLNMGYEFLDGLEKSKNPVVKQLLSQSDANPLDMQYAMFSALSLGDGEFKRAGGNFEQEEGTEKNVFFATVANAEVMREKFCEIFKDKFVPKKITLEQLTRKKDQEEGSNG